MGHKARTYAAAGRLSDHGLPGALGEIAEVAGLQAALAVAEAVGGTRVTLPAKLPKRHWLIEAAGPEAAAAIVEHFRTLDPAGRERGVRHLYIPFGPTTGAFGSARRRAAHALNEGATVAETARRSGLSERAIYRLKARQAAAHDGEEG